MSWASRRRATYLAGIALFFAIVIGVPVAYMLLTVKPTCDDGVQNQGETAVDRGGPCPLLDARALQPHAILWTRAFRVRDGSYNAVAYIQNPNKGAAVRQAHYRFALYDSRNVLVAERSGAAYLMPGTITPLFEPSIDVGMRTVVRTYLEFTDPLVWERADNAALAVSVGNKQLLAVETTPRITAMAENTSVADILNPGPSFVAVVFDPVGNAFAASATTLARLDAGVSAPISFSWPDPFPATAGRIDIIPLVPPVRSR